MTPASDGRGRANAPAPPPSAGRSRTHLQTARELVPHVLTWLRRQDADEPLRTVAGWSMTTRSTLRHFLIVQGLAPRIADLVSASNAAVVPAGAEDTARWLAEQLAQSRVRAARFGEDLAAILDGAASAGVAVMPMKGAVLAFARYREPGLRPMADLDLLVRPADEPRLHDVLVRVGYRLLDDADRRRHRTYGRPGDRVVATESVHPDNPRKVEVHTGLFRSVWTDHAGVDLAPRLWSAVRHATLVGRPALVPSDAAMLFDVASHATSHLVRGTGRVLHWVDVAELAADVEVLDDAFAELTYPVLALAARALADDRLASRVAGLAPAAGASLTRLAARVPLDDRAGLNLRGVNHERLGWWASRWQHWRPNPWLVRLASPRLPVALAYGAYVAGVGASLAREASRLARRRGPIA